MFDLLFIYGVSCISVPILRLRYATVYEAVGAGGGIQ